MNNCKRRFVSGILIALSCVLLAIQLAAGPNVFGLKEHHQNESPLVVSPEALKLGDIWPNESFEFTLPISNRSSQPVTIEDFKTSCACTSANTLPLVIAPRSTLAAQFTLRMTSSQLPWLPDAQFAGFRHLITPQVVDHPSQPFSAVSWRISGRLRRLLATDVFGPFEIVKTEDETPTSRTFPVKFPVRTLLATSQLQISFNDIGHSTISSSSKDNQFDCAVAVPLNELDIGDHVLRGVVSAMIHGEAQEVTLPCELKLHIVGDLQAMPPQLTVGVVEPNLPCKCRFTVRSRSRSSFRIARVGIHSFSDSSFEPSEVIFDDQASMPFHTVELSGNVVGDGHVKAAVTVSIICDDQKKSRDLTIPFTSYVWKMGSQP